MITTEIRSIVHKFRSEGHSHLVEAWPIVIDYRFIRTNNVQIRKTPSSFLSYYAQSYTRTVEDIAYLHSININ